MTKSQRPRIHELRDIYLLLGECRELGRDPRTWQHHLISGLNRILNSRLGCSVLASFDGFEGMTFHNACFAGLDDGRDTALFIEYQRSGDVQTDPMAVAHKQIPGAVVTRRRVELVPEPLWRRSTTLQHYFRLLHLHDALLGRLAAGNGLGLHLGFLRDAADPHFEIRQRRLVHLLSLALKPFIGTCLAIIDHPDSCSLPPRLREVLHLLMRGLSEKEIAHRLAISSHTAHFHINRLHQYFNVSSRGELLARAFAQQPTLFHNGDGHPPPAGAVSGASIPLLHRTEPVTPGIALSQTSHSPTCSCPPTSSPSTATVQSTSTRPIPSP